MEEQDTIQKIERHVWKNLDINTSIKAVSTFFFFFYLLRPDSALKSFAPVISWDIFLIQAWHQQILLSFMRTYIWQEGRSRGTTVALFSG